MLRERDALMGTVRSIVARMKRIEPERVEPESALSADLALTSLDLAQLVAELEIELGFDPFTAGATVRGVRTVADLCAVYERHAPGPA